MKDEGEKKTWRAITCLEFSYCLLNTIFKRLFEPFISLLLQLIVILSLSACLKLIMVLFFFQDLINILNFIIENKLYP